MKALLALSLVLFGVIDPPTMAQPSPKVAVSVRDDGPNFWVIISAQPSGGPDSLIYSVTQGAAVVTRRQPASVLRDSVSLPRPASGTVSGQGCVQSKRRGQLSANVCKPWTSPTEGPPPDPGVIVTVDSVLASNDVLFDDAFARAGACAKASSVNGTGWTGTSLGSGDTVYVTPDAQSPSGCALAVVYAAGPGGDDGWAEPNFSIGGKPTEVFVGFVVKSPANFAHRDSTGPDNNKLLRLWDSLYTGSTVHVGMSTLPTASGTSVVTNEIMEGRHTDVFGPWKPVLRAGRADTIGYYAKTSSGIDVPDGVVRVWINRMQVYERTDVRMGNPGGVGFNAFGNGYLFGWSNSGFNERTEFRVWRFVIARKPVGWFLPA